MKLEIGPFQPTRNNIVWRDLGKIYEARIVIFSFEDERLETGVFEKAEQLTPFVSWLHAEVGSANDHDWSIHRGSNLEYTTLTTVVYFRRLADATLFFFRWSP